FALPRERGVRPGRSGRAWNPVGRSSRPSSLEHAIADSLGQRRKRIVLTGADGQLGRALREELAEAELIVLTRADWEVTEPPPLLETPDLVLHAAAWTDVD